MIISLGEALIDFVSQKELKFEGFPGGSPLNTSIAISRLGVPCQFLGRISNDMFGCRLIDHLHDNSVGTDMILRTDNSTTLSFVQKQPDGQAMYGFFANNTADRNWSHKEMNSIKLPEEAKIIHFGSISLSLEPGGTIISDFLLKINKNIMLSFDPNIRPSLVPDRDKYIQRFQKLCRVISVIKLSDEDLEWIFPDLTTDEAIDHLLKSGISLIALTTGKTGAWMINGTNRVLSPIYDLPVSDTIGAGDTFHGALLSYLHKKYWLDRKTLKNLTEDHLREIGDYANTAAGINCSRSGANPPTSTEMEDALGKV